MAEPPSGADAGVPDDNSVAPASDRVKDARIRERAYLIGLMKAALTDASWLRAKWELEPVPKP
jgi:hypothetical protein